MCIYFFFFKQKTAYELRISDWSSDVCSSDLRDIGHGLAVFALLHLPRQAAPGFQASATRRGLAGTPALRVSIIEHCANPVADLACGFGNFLPDRRQHRDNVGRANSAGRNVAQFRKGVVFQTGEPLAGIDGAFPARLILSMILARGLAERHLRGGLVFPFRSEEHPSELKSL